MARLPRILLCSLLLAVAPQGKALHESVGFDGRLQAGAEGRKSSGRLAFVSRDNSLPLASTITHAGGKQLRVENNESQVAASIAGPALLGSLGFAAFFGGARDPAATETATVPPAPSKRWPLACLAAIPLLLAAVPLFWSLQSQGPMVSAKKMAEYLPKGFVEAISLILFSELGDKTFFVAGEFCYQSARVVCHVRY